MMLTFFELLNLGKFTYTVQIIPSILGAEKNKGNSGVGCNDGKRKANL